MSFSLAPAARIRAAIVSGSKEAFFAGGDASTGGGSGGGWCSYSERAGGLDAGGCRSEGEVDAAAGEEAGGACSMGAYGGGSWLADDAAGGAMRAGSGGAVAGGAKATSGGALGGVGAMGDRLKGRGASRCGPESGAVCPREAMGSSADRAGGASRLPRNGTAGPRGPLVPIAVVLIAPPPRSTRPPSVSSMRGAGGAAGVVGCPRRISRAAKTRAHAPESGWAAQLRK